MKPIRVTIDPDGYGNKNPYMYFDETESVIFLTGTIKEKLKSLRLIKDFYLVPAEVWEKRAKDL